MTILEIYEKVSLVMPLEQRRFFNYFADSARELITLYPGFVAETDEKEYTPPESLNDDTNILPLYHNAIVDNVLFLAGGADTYKGEFIRKSKLAFLKYWNDKAKGKRVKRMRW